MTQLTDKEKQRYIANRGAKCPYCGSFDLEASTCEAHDGATAEQKIFCGDCDRSWYDVYTLTDVRETED